MMTSSSVSSDTEEYFIMRLTLPSDLEEGQVSFFADCFTEEAVATTVYKEAQNEGEPWHLQWVLDFRPDQASAMARFFIVQKTLFKNRTIIDSNFFSIEPLPRDVNWLEKSYRQFEPFTIGHFLIHGSHFEGATPEGLSPLCIDAATAFGSGEHETTAGCIEALIRLKDDGFAPQKILDMGTGSGILAIAAAKLWPGVSVMAVDNDPEAVIVAARHAAMNNEGNITCLLGEGFLTKDVSENAPFELIIANILAGPLKDMAEDMLSVTLNGGRIILSGMMNTQADDVLAVYAAKNAHLISDIRKEVWSALVLEKM